MHVLGSCTASSAADVFVHFDTGIYLKHMLSLVLPEAHVCCCLTSWLGNVNSCLAVLNLIELSLLQSRINSTQSILAGGTSNAFKGAGVPNPKQSRCLSIHFAHRRSCKQPSKTQQCDIWSRLCNLAQSWANKSTLSVLSPTTFLISHLQNAWTIYVVTSGPRQKVIAMTVQLAKSTARQL